MPGRTIVFVGGGSLGHIAPAVAVWEAVKRRHSDWHALFICANRPDEVAFLTAEKLPFHAVNLPHCRFLRTLIRAMSAMKLFFAALSLLKKEKPAVVFGKGGFLSIPFCLAAKIKGIPVVLHESDAVMGRANAFIARFATAVCLGFSGVATSYKLQATSFHTGNPVRSTILEGSKDAGKRITGFSLNRPVLLIIGGSQGAKAINEAVRRQLPRLLELADVIHITGRGKDESAMRHAHYFTREMVTDELKDLYAIATLVVTRAGASALSELAALRKPAIVVPLREVGHDHQNENARRLAETGAIELLPQEQLSSLSDVLGRLLAQPVKMSGIADHLHDYFPVDATERIAEVLFGAVIDQHAVRTSKPSII